MTSQQPALRLTEIFFSLQGEARTAGLPTVFVRLTGCPLRCGYCDTAYAFHGGNLISLEEIVEEVAQYPTRHVTVTGGEPLAQPNCLPLLTQLCDLDYLVSLETSGALPVADVDPRVSKVMDIKTPDSGEEDRNLWQNLDHLTDNDQLKFVICSRGDYEWARAVVNDRGLNNTAGEVLFSPVWETLPPANLADWILEDGLPVRMQVQLHKILWGEQQGK